MTRTYFDIPVYTLYVRVYSSTRRLMRVQKVIFSPLRVAVWYGADLVYYAYQCKLTQRKIKFCYKPIYVLKTDHFKPLLMKFIFFYPKYAINTLIGIIGNNCKSRYVNHFTQDRR